VTALRCLPDASGVLVACGDTMQQSQRTDATKPNTVSLHLYQLAGPEPALVLSKSVDTTPHKASIVAMAISPNKQLAATGDRDKEILVWDLPSMQVIASIKGYHQAQVTRLSFSPDSTVLASSSTDCDVMVWREFKGVGQKPLVAVKAHKGGANSVEFLGGTLLVSAGVDGNVKIWELS